MKKAMRFAMIAMTAISFGCGDDSSTLTSPTPVACDYVFSPSRMITSSLPQTIVVQVVATSSCFWVASSTDSWVDIVFQGSKKGSNSLTFNLDGNSCTSRASTGSIKIKGSTNILEITQDGSDLGICS
ncbi:MAG TPA: hypothetical protein VJC06_03160 [Candidatus Paceibacterota bacterium]